MRAAGTSSLQAAVARAVGDPVRELEDVITSDLTYDAFLMHRHLRRISGIAVTATGRKSWSLIEKTTRGPALASDYLIENGRREREAYRSGLLAELPAGVRAPALLGVDDRADGEVVLRLEDVRPNGENATGQGSIVGVAGDLGRLAGTWFGRPVPEPWLFRDWIERHAQSPAQAAGRAVLGRAHPQALRRLGSRLDLGLRLIDAQPAIAALLNSLPQTICHHDAVGANVLRRNRVTVLIDWESVGPGVVGADVASLLFSSARRGDCSAQLVARRFDAAVAAFADGVRQAGAPIDAATVRLGVDAAIALRWKLLADIAAAFEDGRAVRRGSAPQEPPAVAMEELLILGGILETSAERVLEALRKTAAPAAGDTDGADTASPISPVMKC